MKSKPLPKMGRGFLINNMYNHAGIQQCLRGLIGFESSYNTETPAIDADLLASSSGVFVNNLHPLLSYENILNIAEQFSEITVTVYTAAATYKVGYVVKVGADV